MIEEILRIYGYNKVEIQDKFKSSISNFPKYSNHKIENALANQLISFGFYETITNSLTTEKYSNLNSSLKIEDNIRILNPLSNDLGILRRSMLFSGLESIAYNLNRQQQRLKLFEFGKTYCLLNGDREETKHLSIVMTGPKDPMHWRGKGENIDFFYTKGIVSSLIEKIGTKKTKSFPVKNPIFDEGQSLKIGANKLVEFGLVNSEISSKFGIDQPLYFICLLYTSPSPRDS